ncbi:MAG: hypothetical protein V3V16_14210, partial [Melioribacteraceae bacterium]
LMFFSFIALLGQSNNLIKELSKKYESFEYEKVISLSKKVFNSGEKLERSDSRSVFTMLAVSYFSISQKDSARSEFVKILQMDKNHKLNPQIISPKIISYFEQIKNDFKIIFKNVPIKKEPPKNILVSEPEQITNEKSIVQTSLSRSLLLPGMGHLYLGNKTKGWLLTTASTLTLGSMIYFIIETNNKEALYLSETNLELVKQKYSTYDTSYKIRNSLIISYAVMWLYSQIDLLFFSEDLISAKIHTTVTTNILGTTEQKYIFSLRIQL